MYDWQKSLADNKLFEVREAKAMRVDESSMFAAVSKCMARAVFVEFRKPGKGPPFRWTNASKAVSPGGCP